MQFTIFDMNCNQLKIDKPVRLIEFFAGYGSQHFSLEEIARRKNIEVESWKICEWAVKSIQAYKDAHFSNDNTNYSKNLTKEQIIDYLSNKGISSNYNEPMTYQQIKRLGEDKLRIIYNNIMATHNLVNIQKVKGCDLEIKDTDKYCYIMTYSFPCQDLSKAGLGKGMVEGSGTRSGMLWEVDRILNELRLTGGGMPQVLLMENVPDVIGNKNIKEFAKWLARLEEFGYKCHWNVLNAKDYGIPQNRERCFMVSNLQQSFYDFPQPIKLKNTLKDILEKNVNEKYYLSEKQVINASKWNTQQNPFETLGKEICPTLTTRSGAFAAGMVLTTDKDIETEKEIKKRFIKLKDKELPIIKITDNYIEWFEKGKFDVDNRAWKDDKIAPTITTGGNSIKILEKQNDVELVQRPRGDNKGGILKTKICPTITTSCFENNVYVKENLKTKLCDELAESGILDNEFVINHSYTNGLCGKNKNSRTKLEDYIETKNGISPTLTTRPDCLGVVVNYRIRKLTPKECFRLMGVRDECFERIAKNQSDASLYHLAGDSIVINVLIAIFNEMF